MLQLFPRDSRRLELWVQFKETVQFSRGFGALAKLRLDLRQIEPGFEVTWVQPNRRRKMSRGLGEFPQPSERQAESIVGAGLLRFEAGELGKMVGGIPESPLFHQHQPGLMMRFGKVGRDVNGLLEHRERLTAAVQPGKTERQLKMNFLGNRILLQRFLEGLRRPFHITALEHLVAHEYEEFRFASEAVIPRP